MPRTKASSKVKKATPRSKRASEVEIDEFETTTYSSSTRRLPGIGGLKANRLTAILAILLILLGLAYYKRAWFVAAMVNGQPISAFEVNKRVNSAYRSRVLDQMVNDTILAQEANKKGIKVSQDSVNNKMKEIETSYGGPSVFDSLLQQQGLTRSDFEDRVRVQLLAEELYKDEIKPKDEDIEKFMKDNESAPEATDPAKFRTLAENELKQQKLSEVFSQKFQELKKNANVQIF